MTYAHKRFGKFQDKSQIINATTKHQKLSTNKYSNLLGTIPIGPAMLQNQKTKKRKQKNNNNNNNKKQNTKQKEIGTHTIVSIYLSSSHIK